MGTMLPWHMWRGQRCQQQVHGHSLASSTAIPRVFKSIVPWLISTVTHYFCKEGDKLQRLIDLLHQGSSKWFPPEQLLHQNASRASERHMPLEGRAPEAPFPELFQSPDDCIIEGEPKSSAFLFYARWLRKSYLVWIDFKSVHIFLLYIYTHTLVRAHTHTWISLFHKKGFMNISWLAPRVCRYLVCRFC